MAFQLHHLFQFVTDQAEAESLLLQVGLNQVHAARQPGQGTASYGVSLANARLDLLWPVDESELSSAGVVRTRLGERSRWRENGACPFGLALSGRFPFPFWDYRPPYLPDGPSFPVALASEDPRQPFLFKMPTGVDVAPGECLPDTITGLALEVPVAPALAIRMLADEGVLSVKLAVKYKLTVALTGPNGTRSLSLPDFVWV